jgi:hypothetical protein
LDGEAIDAHKAPAAAYTHVQTAFRAFWATAAVLGALLLFVGGLFLTILRADYGGETFGSRSGPFFQTLGAIFGLTLTPTTSVTLSASQRVSEMATKAIEDLGEPVVVSDGSGKEVDLSEWIETFRNIGALIPRIHVSVLLVVGLSVTGIIVDLFYLANPDTPIPLHGACVTLGLFFLALSAMIYTFERGGRIATLIRV